MSQPTFPFTELPADIQRYTAEFAPNLVRLSPRLSQIGGTLPLREVYERRICTQIPTQQEFLRVLEQQRIQSVDFAHFTTLRYPERSEGWSEYKALLFHPIGGGKHTAKTYSVTKWPSGEFAVFFSPQQPMTGYNFTFTKRLPLSDIVNVDLQSLYKLYTNRRTCRQITFYAKNQILRLLDQLEQDLSSTDTFTVLKTVIYIAVNAEIFGLPNYYPSEIGVITPQLLQDLKDTAFDQLGEIRTFVQRWA